MKRSTRTTLARETMDIIARGRYTSAASREIPLADDIAACVKNTEYYLPETLDQIRSDVLSRPSPGHPTRFEVVNETTLEGIARLVAGGPVAALNFASAKNPGGGFLNGSQAQEESLARSSALHASLTSAFEFYERHRAAPSLLYSDAMIFSPRCPVFRTDAGDLLDPPHHATFITSAAPNAGAIATNRPEDAAAIPGVLRHRAELVLALAASHACGRLVLGAWGCGVFRNDPVLVANVFAEHLRGLWSGRFEHIVFSVLDTSPAGEIIAAFRDAFPG